MSYKPRPTIFLHLTFYCIKSTFDQSCACVSKEIGYSCRLALQSAVFPIPYPGIALVHANPGIFGIENCLLHNNLQAQFTL